MSEEFYVKRAVLLPSKDMVLFIFNHANDTYVNMDQVDISSPEGFDDVGRTIVTITGKGEVGPRGNGGYTGEVKFRYRRVDLGSLELPTNGDFYDPIVGKVGFLTIVKEFVRRTGYNLTEADFVQTPFDPASSEPYVLKAAPNSWRFQGEVSLGVPKRTDLDAGIPLPSTTLDATPYAEEISRVLRPFYIGLDLTPWPELIDTLALNRRILLTDTALLAALNGQAGKGDLTFTIGAGPNARLNLYQATVVYRGKIRAGIDPIHIANKTLDSVIVLRPNANYGDDAIGDLVIHYNSSFVVQRLDADRYGYMLQRQATEASGFGREDFWSKAKVGQFVGDLNGGVGLPAAFMQAFGIGYESTSARSLVVEYNGPVPDDAALPGDNPNINAVKLTTTGGRDNLFHGSAFVYYGRE